ncbi:MAG: restriction endonuclease subunit S [Treponema sp.]|nr:restriction endonuclease subunit S [Treponema sp.]
MSFGRPYILKIDGCIHDGWLVLQNIQSDIDKDYLYSVLSSPSAYHQFEKMAVGGVVNNLNSDKVKELIFHLPPLAEQKHIVTVLDKCTALIAKHKRMLEKHDMLIKSRFIEMFGDNKYPLKSIENYIDKNILSAKKRYAVEDVIKYIDISSIDNIHNTIIGHTEYIFEKAPSRAQQCVRKNDILISTIRPNLKNVALIQKNGDFVASSGFCVLRPRCIPEYLFVNVITDSFTNEMKRKTTGANYPAIKNADVYDYLIPDVPLALQEKFAEFVRAVDAEKALAQKSLGKAETLYKALMQRYFA